MPSSYASYITSICDVSVRHDAPYWIKSLIVSPLTQNELHDYLNGHTATQETLNVLNQYPVVKKRWILLREQLQTFLPLTLRRKLNEHYGKSQNEDFPGAVPYRANNVPTQCIFGHFLENTNYTTQMLLAQGLTINDLKSLLQQWQNAARLSRLEQHNQISVAEQQFRLVFPGEQFIGLLEINLENTDLLQALHEYSRHDPKLLRAGICTRLQRLTTEPQILHSNAINAVNQFQQVTAITGTPSNHNTYHQDLHMINETTLGVDAQTKRELLAQPHPEYASSTDFKTYLEEKIQETQNLNALIDYGGFFRGVDNLEAAKILANICDQHAPTIQYVLFYQGDTLYALNIKSTTIKKLQSSDSKIIETELGCSAQERFTYYDQEHTLGSDISQANEAVGLLTIDMTLGEISKSLQAAKRMRNLGTSGSTRQSLIIAVNELADENRYVINTEQVLQKLSFNEQKTLATDHFRAGLKKIHNIFRNDLLQRILQQTDPNKRDALSRAAHAFFINNHECDITSFSEQAPQEQNTKSLLESFAVTQKTQWHAITQVENSELGVIITNIIDHAVKICSPTQKFQVEQCGVEIQQQQEKQKETQQEQQQEQQNLIVSVRPISYDAIMKYLSSKGQNNKNLCMNHLIKQQFPKITWKFSDNLYVSPNFVPSPGKQNFYNPYTKPGLSILFQYNADDDTVQGILICAEEAARYKNFVKYANTDNPTYWITTVHGDGHIPTPLAMLTQATQTKVHELTTQVQLLTGNVNALCNNKSNHWIKQETQEKFEFLKKIAPYVGLEQQALDRFVGHFINLRPYIKKWLKSPSGEIDEFLKHLSQAEMLSLGTIQSLKTLLPYLAHIKNNILDLDKPPSCSEVENNIYLNQYYHTLKFTNLCTHSSWLEIIQYWERHKGFIDNSYCQLMSDKYMIIESIATQYPEELSYLARISSSNNIDFITKILNNFERYQPILKLLALTNIQSFNPPKQIKSSDYACITNLLKLNLSKIIDDHDELKKLLSTPESDLNQEQKILILEIIKEKLRDSITYNFQFINLLSLDNNTLSAEQKTLILEGMQNKFGDIITYDFQLINLLSLDNNTLSAEQKTLILEGMQNKLGDIITDYFQLRKLLSLDNNTLSAEQKTLILEGMQNKLGDIIVNHDQFMNLLSIPEEVLNKNQKKFIAEAADNKSTSNIKITQEYKARIKVADKSPSDTISDLSIDRSK